MAQPIRLVGARLVAGSAEDKVFQEALLKHCPVEWKGDVLSVVKVTQTEENGTAFADYCLTDMGCASAARDALERFAQ